MSSSGGTAFSGLLTGVVVYENFQGVGLGAGAGAGAGSVGRPVTPNRRALLASSPLDSSLIASEDSDAATVLHLATFV